MDEGVGLRCVWGLNLSRLCMEGRWYDKGQRQRRHGERLAMLLPTLIEEEFAKKCLLDGLLHTDAPGDRVAQWHLGRIIGRMGIETSIPTLSTHHRAAWGFLW
jgi:hypothetical protein